MSLPPWFAQFLRLAKTVEMSESNVRVAEGVCDYVDSQKALRIQRGKRWGDVGQANKKSRDSLRSTKKARMEAKKLLTLFVEKLAYQEQFRLRRMREMCATREIGYVRCRALRNTLRNPPPPTSLISDLYLSPSFSLIPLTPNRYPVSKRELADSLVTVRAPSEDHIKMLNFIIDEKVPTAEP
jgi:hypothetical protein